MIYNLRKGPILGLPKTHSFYYVTTAIHFRGSLTWNNLPADVKSSDSLFEFKNKIKNIGDIDCEFLICRDIYNIHMIWYSWNLLYHIWYDIVGIY